MKKNILAVLLAAQVFVGISQAYIRYSDTINFEEPCSYLYIDSSAMNLWQTGVPGKTIFDSAYSKPFAIITDTTNYYTPNNHSAFILKLEPECFQENCNTLINFWHKFDTDSINDYGVVEVSYDEGENWKDVYNDTTYLIHYLRNSSSTDQCLATGQSNGWVQDNIVFHFYLTPVEPPDTVWLRFSFYSDSIQNENEGWMIDDITILCLDIWGIEENTVFNSYPYPNPCQEYLSIVVPDNESLNFTVYIYDYLGKIVESEKFIGEPVLLNTKSYKNGMYFYRIINNIDKKSSRRKFILKK